MRIYSSKGADPYKQFNNIVSDVQRTLAQYGLRADCMVDDSGSDNTYSAIIDIYDGSGGDYVDQFRITYDFHKPRSIWYLDIEDSGDRYQFNKFAELKTELARQIRYML